MQIFSKKRDTFKNRRDAGQSIKKQDCPAKIGTCGHFRQNLSGWSSDEWNTDFLSDLKKIFF